jgi:hypothetical protein
MISITGNTGRYILQPSLISMHQQGVEWLSASSLWKREISFFQKLLDEHSPKATSIELKKEMDHFQNIIIYYGGEVVDVLRKKIRQHESELAQMLQSMNESDTKYFKEHESVVNELAIFAKIYNQFRHEFFGFIEKLI